MLLIIVKAKDIYATNIMQIEQSCGRQLTRDKPEKSTIEGTMRYGFGSPVLSVDLGKQYVV